MSLRERKLRKLVTELKQLSNQPLRSDPEHRHLFDPTQEGFHSGLKEAARKLEELLNELGFSYNTIKSDALEEHKIK